LTEDNVENGEVEKNKTADAYHFYQAADGQQLYLHSTNFRCLKNEFKTEDNLPPKLKIPIVDFAMYIQNETTRNHFRFLSHLPLTSKFSLAFVDLSGFLTGVNKDEFARELRTCKERLKKKQKDLQREEKRRARVQQHSGGASYEHLFLQGDAIGSLGETFPGLVPNPLGFAPPADVQQHSPQVTGWSSVADRGFASAFTSPTPSSPPPLSGPSNLSTSNSSSSSSGGSVPPAASANWSRVFTSEKTPAKQKKKTTPTVLFSTSSRMTM